MKPVAIILNYNDADTTLEQLSRLLDYKSLSWLIVVDNASTDDSQIRLKYFVAKHLDKCIFVQNKQNLGYGQGNNVGLLTAVKMRARFALVLNPDAKIADDVILQMTKKMKRMSDLAMIAPVMVNGEYPLSHPVNQPGTREHALHGATAFPIRSWLHELLETGPITRRIFQKFLHYPKKRFERRTYVSVDALAGALYLCNIHKILEVGGYDKEVFLYMEESILGKKLKDFGYRSALFLKGHYVHRHSTTIKKAYHALVQRQRIRGKSTLYYLKKYQNVGIFRRWIAWCFLKIVELEDVLYALWMS